MTQIEVRDDTLTLHLDGIDRLLALTRRLDIPLDRLISVEPVVRPSGPRQSLRGLAASVSRGARTGKGSAGQSGSALGTLAIDLLDARYTRLVVEVEDVHAVARTIRQACAY